MNRNSFGLWVPPRKPSTWTKIPSEPSSAAPTATLSPFRTRRGSVVTRSSPVVCTITQSIRGRRGRRQPLGSFTYVGRFVVGKKPSGRTPSAGAGVNRASGAPPNRGAGKVGGRGLKPGRTTRPAKKPKGKSVSQRGNG